MAHTNPCTIAHRMPVKVRGGKGFEARYQAELAASAKHAAAYCGSVVYTLHWGATGDVRSVTAAPECEVFYAECTMPEVAWAPKRYVPASVIAAAVNECGQQA